MSNNKLRFYYVLEILSKYSDENHYIKTPTIIEKLKSDYGFKDVDRKTIYEDIAVLCELGYDIDSYKGYSLTNNSLSLGEIKIIEDMLNDNKSIDNHNSDKIIDILRSKTSIYNQEILNKLSLKTKKKESKTYLFIGLILDTIAKEETIIIESKNNQNEIIPYLLHLSNSYYYLYYSYLNNDKIYHIRLDNIKNIKITSIKHHSLMRFNECHKLIKESVGSFISNCVEEIKLEVIKDDSFIIEHILDNFDNAILKKTKDKTYINLKLSVSSVLFSKLTLYQDKIKIIEPEYIKDEYKKFLNDIIKNY